MPVKWFWFNLGLRGKFWALVLISFLIWLSNFLIVYFEIHGINQATLDLEKCEDLYNTVLEIRRYEKNFLLYHDRADLDETLNQFNHAWQMLVKLSTNAGIGKDSNYQEKLESDLQDYGNVLDILAKAPLPKSPDEAVQEKIKLIFS